MLMEKRTVTREELEPLVSVGQTISVISKQLDLSPHLVRRWIERYGLPQPREVRRAQLRRAIETGAQEIVRACPKHGETAFAVIGSERRARCKLCRSEAVVRRRRRVKALMVDEAGGKCAICLYDRCLNALEFHHLDPTEKEFGVSMRGITRSIEAVRAEAAKCVLLCANCHAEVEAGLTEVPLQFR
jgi:hypothetical protein